MEIDKGFHAARLISWPLRVTACLLLAYILLVIVTETSPWQDIYVLFSPDRPVWVISLLAMVFLANLILWPLWCGFSNRALQAGVQPELKTKPLMATLWFFIPGAFVFMPWPVVREIYLASEDPLEWEDRKAPIIGWWWCARQILYFGFWLLSKTTDLQDAAFGRVMVFQLVIVAELVLQIILLTRMTQWQARPLKTRVAEAF